LSSSLFFCRRRRQRLCPSPSLSSLSFGVCARLSLEWRLCWRLHRARSESFFRTARPLFLSDQSSPSSSLLSRGRERERAHRHKKQPNTKNRADIKRAPDIKNRTDIERARHKKASDTKNSPRHKKSQRHKKKPATWDLSWIKPTYIPVSPFNKSRIYPHKILLISRFIIRPIPFYRCRALSAPSRPARPMSRSLFFFKVSQTKLPPLPFSCRPLCLCLSVVIVAFAQSASVDVLSPFAQLSLQCAPRWSLPTRPDQSELFF
jgi:hypothetical protein